MKNNYWFYFVANEKTPFKGAFSWSIYLNYFLGDFLNVRIPAAAAIAATPIAITGSLSPVLGDSEAVAGAFLAV